MYRHNRIRLQRPGSRQRTFALRRVGARRLRGPGNRRFMSGRVLGVVQRLPLLVSLQRTFGLRLEADRRLRVLGNRQFMFGRAQAVVRRLQRRVNRQRMFALRLAEGRRLRALGNRRFIFEKLRKHVLKYTVLGMSFPIDFPVT